LVSYLHTDTICYHEHYPEALVELQKRHWEPIIEWAQSKFGIQLKNTSGIVGIRQSDETVCLLRSAVEQYSSLKLAGW
jgi:ATP synthase F1 complex assembly factor 2